MSKGPTAMATSKTKQRGPGAGTTSKKRGKKPAPSAASEAIVSAMMLDDSCHGEERDAPSDPRDGGGEGRDSCDVRLSDGRTGRSNGAGVKKKLKAKAAAAAAASFDADEVLNPSAAHPANPAPSSSALHPSFGCVHAAAVMMQADMNLNDASFDLLQCDGLLPQDSFGFNLPADQSLSFDMTDGPDHGQAQGRESAGWAREGGDPYRVGGSSAMFPPAGAVGDGTAFDSGYGLPVTVSSSVEHSTPKRMEHQVSFLLLRLLSDVRLWEPFRRFV